MIYLVQKDNSKVNLSSLNYYHQLYACFKHLQKRNHVELNILSSLSKIAKSTDRNIDSIIFN